MTVRLDPAPKNQILAKVTELLARQTCRPSDEIDVSLPFSSFGIDSVTAVGLSGELETAVGFRLSPTLLYENPSIDALVDSLCARATALAAAPAGETPAGETVQSPRAGEVARKLADLPPARRAQVIAALNTRVTPAPVNEPIAIVGVGCRFPGAASVADYWALLRDGVDAVREVPADRWNVTDHYDPAPGTAGKMSTRWGGFLDAVDRFDPQLFRISPRECASMDPQQRLLLEVAWEALEAAGIAPSGLGGSRTGVFIGIANEEYSKCQSSDYRTINPYTGTGIAYSVAAGRISYVFGLRGPSLAVDTACSSSLVALHLAAQSLRSGESELALAGGVNVILSPRASIYFSQVRVMSPQGRCKTFDAAADGYVRSEGCGVVVLKRLGAALAAGDRVLAVLRGSAVNHDGHSGGLTVPNGLAQQEVIRAALDNAKVRAADVSYVEAHGTGTQLGDSIELRALHAVFAREASDQPLHIGSVKTNFGHAEAAAGIAGFIKVILALQHRAIPPHLHFQTLNANIESLAGVRGVIPTALSPWFAAGRRIAGVSSFGISGTNAHVVLEEAPRPDARAHSEPASTPFILPLSAADEPALRALARSYREVLEREHAPAAADVCSSAGVRRAHHDVRLAAVGSDRAELVAQLAAHERGEADPGLFVGRRSASRERRVVFLFPGQGSQWLGMGRELLRNDEHFRQAFAACDAAVKAWTGWSPTDELHAGEAASRLHEIDVVQPVLFALQVSLAAAWRGAGIEPDIVLGQSMGEIAAACVAGALSLADAARVVCRRSAIMKSRSGTGAMAVVELSEAQALLAIRGKERELSVAVCSSPRSTVLSGEPAAIDAIVAQLEGREVFARRVPVDVASHSPHMDPLLDRIAAALDGITPRAARIPLYSTVDACRIDGADMGAAYWVRNLREPVRFATAVQQLLGDGCDLFVEVSPHPVLLPAVEQGATAAGKTVGLVASLRKDVSETASFRRAVAEMYVAGQTIAWAAVAPVNGAFVDLPTYPWQRERFWLEPDARSADSSARSAPAGHPLLGLHVPSSTRDGLHLWHGAIDAERLPFLRDHRVRGAVVLPAAVYLEMALVAGREHFGEQRFDVADLELGAPLVIDADRPRTTQFVLDGGPGDDAAFTIRSAAQATPGAELRWVSHASGTLRPLRDPAPNEPSALDGLRRRLPQALTAGAFYAGMTRRGLEYGSAFRLVADVLRGEREALVTLVAPGGPAVSGAPAFVSPLLDACLQAIAATGLADVEAAAAFVPAGLRRFRVHTDLQTACFAHARITSFAADGTTAHAEIALYDESGRLVAEIEDLVAKRLEPNQAVSPRFTQWLFEIGWEKIADPPAADEAGPPATWIVFGDRGAATQHVLATLGRRGATCRLVERGSALVRAAEIERGVREALGSDAAPCAGVVNLWPLASAGAADPPAVAERECGSLLEIAQVLARAGFRDWPRLWLITSGAQAPAAGDAAHPEQASLWGFACTLAHELPDLRSARVDLPNAPSPGDLELLCRLIAADGTEDQIAIRDGACFGARLRRPLGLGSSTADQIAGEPLLRRDDVPAFRLAADRPGILDRLTLRASGRPVPGPDEVEIEIVAAGLNFADVLKAMGLYPDAGRDPVLGGECAGRISRLGAAVRTLAVGDEVVAIAPGCFGAFTVVPASAVCPKPAGLSLAEAATVPVAFLTAEYALNYLGRLTAGERVLIHSASGGVGLAALQLARSAGASVFATAGSDGKRAYLRSLGVTDVMDSRSLAFAREILDRTDGQGVDLVLNSLAGPAINRGMEILRPFGRFLELGKRDIQANAALSLGAFAQNRSFFAVDLDRAVRERPALLTGLLRALLARFASGELTPLPASIYPISRASDAFGEMAGAKHIGKIVLRVDEPELPVAPAVVDQFVVRSDASYLITGGTGGLGLLVARWLTAKGARHLALLGRRAEDQLDESARTAIGDLRAGGARVEILSADVADPEQLAAAFTRLLANAPELRGIVHAAGVLDDGLLLGAPPSFFDRVFAAKVHGAWNLHRLTERRELDFLALFSSGAALLGSPGQANYGAANAFLDGLAHLRRARGLPALAIDWGPWADVGLAATEERGGRLAFRGFGSIPPADGIAALEWLLTRRPRQMGVVPIDLRHWSQFYPKAAELPVLRDLLAERGDATERCAEPPLGRELRRLASPSAQRAALEAHLHEQVAHVLRLAKSRLDPDVALNTLGFDSLMALELRNRLEASLGVRLSATMAWNYPTVRHLASYLGEKLGLAQPPAAEAPPAGPAASAPDDDAALAGVLRQVKALAVSGNGAAGPEHRTAQNARSIPS